MRWVHDVFGNSIAIASFRNRPPNYGSKASSSSKPAWWSGCGPRSLRRRRAIRSPIRRAIASTSAECLSAIIRIRPIDWSRGLAPLVRGSRTDTQTLLVDLNAGVTALISYQSWETEGPPS